MMFEDSFPFSFPSLRRSKTLLFTLYCLVSYLYIRPVSPFRICRLPVSGLILCSGEMDCSWLTYLSQTVPTDLVTCLPFGIMRNLSVFNINSILFPVE